MTSPAPPQHVGQSKVSTSSVDYAMPESSQPQDVDQLKTSTSSDNLTMPVPSESQDVSEVDTSTDTINPSTATTLSSQPTPEVPAKPATKARRAKRSRLSSADKKRIARAAASTPRPYVYTPPTAREQKDFDAAKKKTQGAERKTAAAAKRDGPYEMRIDKIEIEHPELVYQAFQPRYVDGKIMQEALRQYHAGSNDDKRECCDDHEMLYGRRFREYVEKDISAIKRQDFHALLNLPSIASTAVKSIEEVKIKIEPDTEQATAPTSKYSKFVDGFKIKIESGTEGATSTAECTRSIDRYRTKREPGKEPARFDEPAEPTIDHVSDFYVALKQRFQKDPDFPTSILDVLNQGGDSALLWATLKQWELHYDGVQYSEQMHTIDFARNEYSELLEQMKLEDEKRLKARAVSARKSGAYRNSDLGSDSDSDSDPDLDVDMDDVEIKEEEFEGSFWDIPVDRTNQRCWFRTWGPGWVGGDLWTYDFWRGYPQSKKQKALMAAMLDEEFLDEESSNDESKEE